MIYIGGFLLLLGVSLSFSFFIVLVNTDSFRELSIKEFVLFIFGITITMTLILYVPTTLIYVGSSLL